KDGQPGEPPIDVSACNSRTERPASLLRRRGPARLPILRPIGDTIAQRVAAELRTAAGNELSASLDGKHY
ncbi:MAG TPA: hypothetical protein VHB99_13795, partial [Pirellulales bacterium]|nr:hypothetical protein [Pirellulales bacterium]